jgi:hypothetical protein
MFHFNHIIAYHWYLYMTLFSQKGRTHHAQEYIYYVTLNDQEDDIWYQELRAKYLDA